MADVDNGASAAAPAAASAPASAASSLASAASSAATAANSPAQGAPADAAGSAQPGSTAPAISGAAATGQPAQTQGTRGPIPYDRHEAALRNAREDAVKQFAWARGLDPAETQRALEIARRLSNPDSARQFSQQLMRELAELGGDNNAEDDAPIEPDLVSEDGKLRTYSAAAVEKREKRLVAQLMRELKPVIEEHKAAQQRRQNEGVIAEGRRVINESLKHARTLPHFKEHEKAIGEKMTQMDKSVVDQVGIVAAMYMAYNAVLQEVVIPGIQGTAEKNVREGQQKIAHAAATAITPNGSTTSATPKGPTNVSQLAAHMEKLSKEGIGARG